MDYKVDYKNFKKDMREMDEILKTISLASDRLAIGTAKRKLKEGEELTLGEQEEILEIVYSYATKELRKHKLSKSTQASVVLKCFSIFYSIGGQKFKGISTATGTTSTGLKNEKENFKMLLAGVDLTSNNRLQKNFSTLISQYENTKKYSDILCEILFEIRHRTESYKQDFASPIINDKQEELQKTRGQILSLSKKYIER